MGEPTSHSPVTTILAAIDRGDLAAADQLLPLVYEELKTLARVRMAGEPAGMTLQPTALVHEAYLRLVGEPGGDGDKWRNRAFFFAAAAEAMRRILVERSRKNERIRHGGGRVRELLESAQGAGDEPDAQSVDLVALDQALSKLEQLDTRMSNVVKLRFFAGLSVEQTAAAMEVSERTVKRDWEYARTWLFKQMGGTSGDQTH